MSKKNIYIAVFVVSVIGLAIVQYRYLEIGLSLARVQFSKNLVTAGDEIRNDLTARDQMTFLLGKALQRDSTYFRLSIDSVQDASRFFLNDFISERLLRAGIEAEFSYDLFSKDTTYYLQSPKSFTDRDREVKYPILLEGYLPELLGERLILELKFRDLRSYFLFQLNGLILPSLLFLIGIVAVIIWILRTYYWQRNLITHTNEFINNLTHELKTPVFSIGLASKLLDQNATEQQKPVLEIIRQQTDRLSGHIDRVLDLARMESRKDIFHLVEVDFRPVLQKLCEDFSTLVALEDVRFTFKLQAGHYPIRAEIFHLENAINNLLDNAKKYSDDPIIELRATLEKGHLVIRIRDNGRGIGPEDQKRIFQKYFRVGEGDLHKVKGYGLGLSYVKKVIDAMKGKINLESKLGEGTAISIQIPLIHG
ncbi:two-component system, OmpR family, phosphate regulon sensor histidine kinase PhoR [Muriicola jejuensis]|uniref:histidine kinase n=1 Tax=Muriicola jejuensis TaxID=504488 RepID=A0A6P0UC86_9FLAO|nr:HAMP domain-containing sensor histidine kinase [Muriicola jejuensis]NER09248.1 GHKL domain-containing protein [Muriicola jejuensis]SMP09985.1 two-component system, OmpR family, phosphate regulon sensor histidine kinase PhoR [Muriicola jejuensis]